MQGPLGSSADNCSLGSPFYRLKDSVTQVDGDLYIPEEVTFNVSVYFGFLYCVIRVGFLLKHPPDVTKAV